LLQQPLPLEAATDALADQLNQLLQLAFVWCLDALKAGRPVVAMHIDAKPTTFNVRLIDNPAWLSSKLGLKTLSDKRPRRTSFGFSLLTSQQD